MRLALERVHGHLPGSLHVLHAAFEVGEVLLQHFVAFGSVIVGEQNRDLVQAHAGGLAAEDHGNAYEVVVVVQPTIGAVALWLEQSDALPVAEYVSLEPESGRCVADGAQI